jgi:hypothetical protein
VGKFPCHALNPRHAHESDGGGWKLVADQLGHSLDVNQNVYTQSPVESRARHGESARKNPASDVNGVLTEFKVELGFVSR